jgi:putative DNA primase/helicase
MSARHFSAVADIESGNDYPLSDNGNAEFFEHEMDHRLAFDHTARQWFEFHGHHWRVDAVQHVVELAVEAMRQRARDAALIADPDRRKRAMIWALKSEERRRIMDLLALAQPKPTIGVDGTTWDSNPLLLGVANGVIELDSVRFRGGMTFDYITKVSPVLYDASARCPRFERFLREVFADALELVDYLQRCFGYCLTGLTTEQVFWILFGLGSNGKSTLMELLQEAIFGAYAWTMPFPTATWTTAVSEYQRAELPGRRLISASEVTQRGHLHEDFIKSLTGSDTVNARRIYGRPFTFVPVGKFWLRCNDRPVIKDLTHSMWRRVKLIPFTQTFPVDATLMPALRAEAPGILNWLLEGCRLWRAEGLCEPACVQAATTEYRDASDVLNDFFEDRCLLMDGCSIGGRELFAAYQTWEVGRGTPADQRLSQKVFGLRVKARFTDIGTTRKVIYSGITVPSEGRP